MLLAVSYSFPIGIDFENPPAGGHDGWCASIFAPSEGAALLALPTMRSYQLSSFDQRHIAALALPPGRPTDAPYQLHWHDAQDLTDSG